MIAKLARENRLEMYQMCRCLMRKLTERCSSIIQALNGTIVKAEVITFESGIATSLEENEATIITIDSKLKNFKIVSRLSKTKFLFLFTQLQTSPAPF